MSHKHFEHIIQMWEAADKVPALVFAGDFWQLPASARKDKSRPKPPIVPNGAWFTRSSSTKCGAARMKSSKRNSSN